VYCVGDAELRSRARKENEARDLAIYLANV